jgi:hypothetical protein
MSDRNEQREPEEMQVEEMQVEEMQVKDALRHFRASVRAWSDRELDLRQGREHAEKRGWHWITAPAMGWALGGALAVLAVTVPASVHHERQIAAARLAVQERQRQAVAAQALISSPVTSSPDDEDLLNHVDSDIAQSTPDAMEPLASLMRDNATQ